MIPFDSVNEKKYAVLIDADNIGSQYIKTVLDEISNKGVATIKRIYGDWCNDNLKPWKEVNLEYSLIPIQQYSYTKGKNSTDSAMIIDAMDILYSDNVDGFCLVSSDSDFTRLAARLREAGKDVVGMGKNTTPQPFVKACTEFKYIDLLQEEPVEEDADKTAKTSSTPQALKKAPKPNVPVRTIKSETIRIIEEKSNEDGWVSASDIGISLKKKFTDFDSRIYGHKKLVGLLESFGLEIDKRPDPNNIANPSGLLVYVRVKMKRSTKSK